MNIGCEIFVTSTPDDFRHRGVGRGASRTGNVERELERVEEGVPVGTSTKIAELQTMKQALYVLKEGKMDVVGFLDALCWGNSLAVTDPTTRSPRTSLTHSDRLAGVFSRLLDPPRTSQGGSKAEGARRTLMPLIIDVLKEVINEEMAAVVEELMEDSADVAEQSVLGTVIEEVQVKVQVIAPVFYDLVRTAACSRQQEERNTLKDPRMCVSLIVCRAAFSRNHLANKMHRPISLYLKACGTAVKLGEKNFSGSSP